MAPRTRLAKRSDHVLFDAKIKAVHWLKRNKRRIATAFHAVLRERHAVDRHRIVVEWEHAYERVLDATLVHMDEEIWGQTDGRVIELHDRIAEYGVCRVTATLAHEALHNTFLMRRKTRSRRWVFMSCDDEHEAMERLGLC